MYQTILNFWFKQLTPEQWWKKDPKLDALIRKKFGKWHEKAVRGELFSWRKSAQGRLAEIIILDQFSRNIFRNKPSAFAFDGVALALAQEAIHCKAHLKLPVQKRLFLYMPFMHSESAFIHKIAVKLFSEPGLKENLEFELAHKAIIDRFGRYPHRNRILGRVSTAKEKAFLKEKNSSF